jgi:hypothetical protein
MEGALDEMGRSVEALAVGVDIDRLKQLLRHWPVVRSVEDGIPNLVERRRGSKRPIGVVAASIEFVTDAALHLQERVRTL